MKKVFCKNSVMGMNDFYINVDGRIYYLFSQKKKRGVETFYRNGVELKKAIKHSGINDGAIHRTMDKLPLYIEYVEQEFGIIIMEKTRKKHLQIA